MKRVAIVNANSFGKYFPKYLDILNDDIGPVKRFTFDIDVDAKTLSDALDGYTYIVLGTVPTFNKQFFELNNSVKHIARFGVGYNNIDVVAANSNGVVVSNIPSVLEKEDVAEQAVSLLMALTKHIVDGDKCVRDLEWNVQRERFMGHRINRKIVGIIGLGHIGSTLARIMKFGFECDVIAYDPYLTEEQFEARFAKGVDLDTLIETADFISLNTNLTEDNVHLINTERISRMKKTAILVNTARGDLVDEYAVADALNQGRISGYGTDVIENEPPQADNPLLFAKNCIITPHLGTYNWECNEDMCLSVVEDIKKVNSGLEPKNRLER